MKVQPLIRSTSGLYRQADRMESYFVACNFQPSPICTNLSNMFRLCVSNKNLSHYVGEKQRCGLKHSVGDNSMALIQCEISIGLYHCLPTLLSCCSTFRIIARFTFTIIQVCYRDGLFINMYPMFIRLYSLLNILPRLRHWELTNESEIEPRNINLSCTRTVAEQNW